MAITIIAQPQNIVAVANSDIAITVAAEGNGLTYQWEYRKPNTTNWVASEAAGANAATVTFTANPNLSDYTYRCVITDANGDTVTTDEIMVTVVYLAITTQPKNTAVKSGNTVSFMVEAVGDGLMYQWEYRKPNTTVWVKSGAAGANAATVTFVANTELSGYVYHCIITNANGDMVMTDEVKLIVLGPTSTSGLISSTTMAAIADAIRTNAETTDAILPADMAGMIKWISGGETLTGMFTPTQILFTVYIGCKLPQYENNCLVIVGGTQYAVHQVLDGVITDIAADVSSKYITTNRNGPYWEVDYAAGTISYRAEDGTLTRLFNFQENTDFRWFYFKLKGAGA